ncbi:MAG: hypothetical protein H7Z75_22280 [Ferruginibacter sp.]|nr:hypothetical protein [Cytophagales bacterium]
MFGGEKQKKDFPENPWATNARAGFVSGPGIAGQFNRSGQQRPAAARPGGGTGATGRFTDYSDRTIGHHPVGDARRRRRGKNQRNPCGGRRPSAAGWSGARG